MVKVPPIERWSRRICRADHLFYAKHTDAAAICPICGAPAYRAAFSRQDRG